MTVFTSPGIYGWYPSDLCSPWYTWFVELGFPELDVNRFEDGSWEIIQYHKTPTIPSMTPFHTVLGLMKKVPITSGFIEKYVNKVNNRNPRSEFWEQERQATKRIDDEQEALARHREETATRMKNAIMANDNVLQRIAKNGLHEMDPRYIRRHIPYYRF